MRSQHHQDAEETRELRLWSHAEAEKALPYLRSVVQSLREYWLQMQQARREMRLMDARPGRPDRKALLARQAASQEAELAEERFQETHRELDPLDVHCLDAAKGLALIPFRQGGDLAWFVFDLFSPQGLDAWRFDLDPLETRRMLTETLDSGLVDRVFASKPWY